MIPNQLAGKLGFEKITSMLGKALFNHFFISTAVSLYAKKNVIKLLFKLIKTTTNNNNSDELLTCSCSCNKVRK
jgi:hypothetical protein